MSAAVTAPPMMTTTRFFEDGKVAENYQKYRPGYSGEVADEIVRYLAEKKSKPFELALDVGCGTGQLTRCLAPHFASVIGCDISSAQIESANAANNPGNVSFKVGQAENLPAADSSVDLLTSATASHYFDWVVFGKQVDRVLKPNGCLVVLAYDLIYIDHPDQEIKKRLTECVDANSDYMNDATLKASTPSSYVHFKSQYKELPLPYSEQKGMSMDVRHEVTVAEFIECYKTYAMNVQFLVNNPDSNHFDNFQKSIMEILKTDDPTKTKVTVWMPIFIRCARKPAATQEAQE